jgi:adenylosuccinate lyase
MLLLVEKGMSRDDAYKLVQHNSMKTWDEDKDFRSLIRNDETVLRLMSEKELDNLFEYSYYTKYVDDIYLKAQLN